MKPNLQGGGLKQMAICDRVGKEIVAVEQKVKPSISEAVRRNSVDNITVQLTQNNHALNIARKLGRLLNASRNALISHTPCDRLGQAFIFDGRRRDGRRPLPGR